MWELLSPAAFGTGSVVEVMSLGLVGVGLGLIGGGLGKFFHHFYIILHKLTGNFRHLHRFVTGSKLTGELDSSPPVSYKLKALAKVLLILVHSGEMDLMAAVVVVTLSGLINGWEVQA